MNYIIEKNIPISIPIKMDYPLQEMDVGDSFIVGDLNEVNQSVISQKCRMWCIKEKNGRKYATRRTKENKVRVFRIK